MRSASANDAYRVILWIWAIGTLVSTLELLVRRADFAPGGMFSWELARLRVAPTAVVWRRRALDTLFGRGVSGLLVARLVLLVLLVLAPPGGAVHDASLVGLVVSTLLLAWRREWGNDGSDQMLAIVLVALFVGFGPFADRFLQVAALVFLCAQVCLAYGVAGAAKLLSPVWRRGEALALILDTSTYGHPRSAALLQRHACVARWLTWSVVVAELAFGLGLVLVLPSPWAWVLLSWGLAFHVATAVFMGLNTFVWAFLATYPALINVHALLRS
jgi:hypothetical protein